jgi:tripartite-type tricarboxylate transporter receptor subunit TctC
MRLAEMTAPRLLVQAAVSWLRRMACIAFGCAAIAAHAQLPSGAYPEKPVRILVGIAPGGSVDAINRMVAQKLSETSGKSFIVENRTGAGGLIAIESLAKASPDGYLLYGGGSQVLTAWPLKRISFDPSKSFELVAHIGSQPYLLIVNAALPVKSLRELVAIAKARPGEIGYASAGLGSAPHLGMEFFNAKAGLSMVHVPYKGNGQAFMDLISGQVQLMLTGGISAAPHISSGKVRAIAVASQKRMQAFPHLSTFSESGIRGLAGFELENYYGLYAPAGLAPDIVNALNREVGRIMSAPDLRARLAADGAEPPAPATPIELKGHFTKLVRDWEEFMKGPGAAIRLE